VRQRDRGIRAVLEALGGVALLFQLQFKLACLFSLVIPTIATITARYGRSLIRAALAEVSCDVTSQRVTVVTGNRLGSLKREPQPPGSSGEK
jgi:ABC-type multidrug transport system fused ATPase/permease subunit